MKPAQGVWGRRFRKARERMGMGQVELARKLKVSQSWLSKVESGRISNPGVNEFLRLNLIVQKHMARIGCDRGTA